MNNMKENEMQDSEIPGPNQAFHGCDAQTP